MQWLPLIGLPILVAGFALRLRPSVVVLVAGIATGFAAKMPFLGAPEAPGILDTLGKAFVDNRIVSLFVLALPAVGLCERYGLQEEARRVISKLRAATVGRVELVYHLFRMAVAALGIRLSSGHVTFSRPLVVPMALEAGRLDASEEADIESVEKVKAASGASENYANFFAQNLFSASAGVALIVNTLKDYGLPVVAARVSLWTAPVAFLSLVLAAGQYMWLDRWLGRRARAAADAEE